MTPKPDAITPSSLVVNGKPHSGITPLPLNGGGALFQIISARTSQFPSPRKDRPASAETTAPRGCGHTPKHGPKQSVRRGPHHHPDFPRAVVPL